MKSKWLLISSISTVLGMVAGTVYLFLAEHSLLLNNNRLVLSAFWSTFVLWAFILMFIIALLFNVLAFTEDKKPQLLKTFHSLRLVFQPESDKHSIFLQDAEQYLSSLGQRIHIEDVPEEYLCIQGQQQKLVYIQRECQQEVDISQIRMLFQKMLSTEIRTGIVISYYGFSSQSRIFAKEANITLIDVRGLKKQQKIISKQQLAMI